MDIRPVDLPELRDETRRDVAANYPAIYEAEIRRGAQFWRPLMAPGPAAAHMVNAELARLGVAELFYVSAEMAGLARTAAESMPDFTLTPDDLPAEYGFLYFASPVDTFFNDDTGSKHGHDRDRRGVMGYLARRSCRVSARRSVDYLVLGP